MNSISCWALFRNWFERRVLGRNTPRLLPRHRGWRDVASGIAVGEGPPVIPEAAAADLQRQLDALAPRHVQIAIHVGPGGTVTRVRSWRWLEWESSMCPRGNGESAIEEQLLNIVLTFQWFICNRTQRAWPLETPLPPGPDDPSHDNLRRHSIEVDAVVPDPEVSLDDGVANLWWEHDGRRVLALTPIPVARR